MANRITRLFADVQIPIPIVHALRRHHGYDVLTVQQVEGTSEPEQGLSDGTVLDIAVSHGRAVLTINGKDFRRLHFDANGNHKGIIICNETSEYRKRAKEIDTAIKDHSPLHGKLIYVPTRVVEDS
jgi:hypothetical protein